MSPEKVPQAVIASVDDGSPASRAGLEAGDMVLAIDGHPVRDILDWQWLTTEDECCLSCLDPKGRQADIFLERSWGEPWGISFEGVIFDGVRTCRNACTFCFMRQLPKGLRRSLYLRDDDFRLSFLSGNFATLTNLGSEDIQRILYQRLSPLRVSLHAVSASVREQLMGNQASRGLENLEALLAGGIQVDAQIVLVPGVNDGAVLEETLTWAYERPGITAVGIVPLGFTDHQDAFGKSFDAPEDALAVLERVQPFQLRAKEERGDAWVFCADEFYLSAYGDAVLDHLPAASFYGGFPLFEDGIGIVRSCVDEWEAPSSQEGLAQVAASLEAAHRQLAFLCGQAMESYFSAALTASPLASQASALFVTNRFFGGNVDVTGLLAGADMVQAIQDLDGGGECIYLVPQVAFNDDGLTVDGMTFKDIAEKSGKAVEVVPSNPLDCIERLKRMSEETNPWHCR